MKFDFLKLILFSLIIMVVSCTSKVVDISDRISDQIMKTDIPFDELDNISKAKHEGSDNLSSVQYNNRAEVQIYGIYIENKPNVDGANAKEDYKDINKKVKTKYKLQNGYPEWFYFDSIVGYEHIAVGSAVANISGFETQKNVATEKARKELERKIRNIVEKEFDTRSIHSGAIIYKSTVAKKARDKTDEIVKKSVVVDEWINHSTLEYYILIGIVEEPKDIDNDNKSKE